MIQQELLGRLSVQPMIPARMPTPTVRAETPYARTEVNRDVRRKLACMIIWRGPASSSARAASAAWLACSHSSEVVAAAIETGSQARPG